MSDLRKAAQQALAAMEFGPDVDPIFAGETIAALRAALAQPDESFCDSHCTWHDHHPDCALAQPKQEPVAYRFQSPATEEWLLGLEPPVGSRWEIEPLYTAPPQRKPLTNEEIYKLFGWYAVPFVRAVEKAHGIGGEE